MKKILLLFIIAFFAAGCSFLQRSSETSPEPTPDLTFAVIGDNEGPNSIFESLMKHIAQDSGIAFVLHVGDIVPNGGAEELEEIQSAIREYGITIPVHAIPGNHDIIDDPDRDAFSSAFGDFPKSKDFGNVHLILLDNADRKVGFTDETLDWLRNDLEEAKGKTILLAFHRPFGYPLADTLGDDETRTSRASNEVFTDILSEHDIAYMFTGHIHTNIEFAFVTKRDNEGHIEKSIPTVVSGGGGQAPQSIFSSLFTEDYHYLKVRVFGNNVTIEKINLDATGIEE